MTGERARRSGVYKRPNSGYPSAQYVNNGGRDEPLTSRGQVLFKASLLVLLALGFVLLALALHAPHH